MHVYVYDSWLVNLIVIIGIIIGTHKECTKNSNKSIYIVLN